MRIAFLGTSEFSVPSLRACAARAEVVTVVTQPDRPGARGRPAPRPVAEAARELGLEVRQPARLRDADVTDALLQLGLDALVVAAYGQILPARLLDGVPAGGINVHASLLPRWRGASPIAAAILAGDEITGVTIMRMDAGVDTGPVLARREIPMPPRATTPELSALLARLGADLLVEVLPRVGLGTAEATPQDGAAATLAPRLSRADAALDWSAWTAIEVDRRVRALNPWPGVDADLEGTPVRLVSGSPTMLASSAAPGTVVEVDAETAAVVTAAGVYRVAEVRPAGRRTMPAAAFLRGRRRR